MEVTFRERGQPFFRFLVDDFRSEVMRNFEGEADPNFAYKSFKLQFDVRLLNHLLYLFTHRKESPVASEKASEWSVLLFETAYLLNSYAVSSARNEYRCVIEPVFT